MNKVSILMPYYNRKAFIPLIIHNIKNQTYPHNQLRLIIDDDSEIKLNKKEIQHLKSSLSPVEVIYLPTARKTIGKKRNDLNKYVFKNYGKKSIVANMDTDDFYNKQYIEYGVNNITKLKYSCVGSSEMLFVYPYEEYKMSYIRTNKKALIHEASLIHTAQFWKVSGGYDNNGTGEGKKMLLGICEKMILDCPIEKCLICISHKNNTIPKDSFLNDRLKLDCRLSLEDRKIIEECLNIEDYEIIEKSDSD